MSIFVCSSNNLTNIWAGIGANMWAVSESQQHKGRVTKSRKMKVGNRGLLYCTETQGLMTPFLVYSKPSIDERIANV
jgi:hypothetical protein